jgi:RNA 2',3'-cyclic 3'-phosphodiesterase
MPQQLSLPGLQATAEIFEPDLTARRGGPQDYKLFFALFLPAADAQRLADRAEVLRLQHGLTGERLAAERLHITLLVVADLHDTVPLTTVNAARAAAASMDCAPLHIAFDHALSFQHNNAFVLRCDARSDAAIARLRQTLTLALRRVGLRPAPSRTPHLTLLYDQRSIPAQHIQPFLWTAHEFVLVLSHTRRTHHQWIDRWPLLDRI